MDNVAGIGASVPRIEDAALLRGRARFIDDINLPHQCYAAFVRSPHACALIEALDLAPAQRAPGVLAAFSASDLKRDGVGVLHAPSGLRSVDGTPIHNPRQLALADTCARYAGDAVAMVLAESAAAAREGAERVVPSYRELPATVDAERALEAGAPRVWEEFGTNVALDWEWGAREEVERRFAAARWTATVRVVNNRVVVAALEPRGALAEYDEETGRYTVWTPTQGGTQVQLALADPGLGVPASKVRVITPQVGGGFGIKNGIYAEQILVAWAARRLGRPVKWYADRSESFLTDYHARDHVFTGRIALDEQGRFLAIHSDVVSNMGAYLTSAAPVIPTGGGTRMLANVYQVGAVSARARCVYTHTTPISAYRGAGKPEYGDLVERLVDAAAEQAGIDRAELRRRNLIRADQMPWPSAVGLVYDSGDFAASLDEALRLADHAGVPDRRRAARERGRLLGHGFSVYTEPDGYRDNRVEMSFGPDGHLTVITSGQTNGQGHATVFTQIAHSLLGALPEEVTVVQGDTDRTGFASGTGGSRTTTVTGAAMHFGAERLVEKGIALGAHLLEASAADIEHHEGRFRVTGTDREVGWREVAALAHDLARIPPGVEPGLAANYHFDAEAYCYPSGCHVCEVEIDAETGALEVTRYLSVSDHGTVINPLLLEGQLHGGIAQGIGQALLEHTAYDPESGQLLSGSFMDYCLPRASHLPRFETVLANTRCTTNPLGVKGVGESGPTAALPAVMSAVRDALAEFDTAELQMPATSERIWRIMRRPRELRRRGG